MWKRSSSPRSNRPPPRRRPSRPFPTAAATSRTIACTRPSPAPPVEAGSAASPASSRLRGLLNCTWTMQLLVMEVPKISVIRSLADEHSQLISEAIDSSMENQWRLPPSHNSSFPLSSYPQLGALTDLGQNTVNSLSKMDSPQLSFLGSDFRTVNCVYQENQTLPPFDTEEWANNTWDSPPLVLGDPTVDLDTDGLLGLLRGQLPFAER
ncbi:hypothetical protein ACP4OV_000632 [Aristida adscensionis]